MHKFWDFLSKDEMTIMTINPKIGVIEKLMNKPSISSVF